MSVIVSMSHTVKVTVPGLSTSIVVTASVGDGCAVGLERDDLLVTAKLTLTSLRKVSDFLRPPGSFADDLSLTVGDLTVACDKNAIVVRVQEGTRHRLVRLNGNDVVALSRAVDDLLGKV